MKRVESYFLNYNLDLDPNFNNEEKLREYRKTKDQNIRNQIIINNLPLVFKIAKNYEKPSKMFWEDLAMIGVFGLMDSIEKYKQDNDSKLSTFAYVGITNAILDEITKEYGQGSSHYGLFIMRYRKLAIKIFGDNESIYKPENIDYILDIMYQEGLIKTKNSIDAVKIAISSMKYFDSYEEVENIPYINPIEEDEYQTDYIRDNYEFLTSGLSNYEKKIIELRYGLNGEEEHKLKEIAKIYGKSHQAISLSSNLALQKIRKKARRIQ